MQIKAKDLAVLLKGSIEGDPEVSIHKASKIEEGEEGSISFLAKPSYEEYAYSTKASIILVSKDFKPKKKIESTLIRVDDVYEAINYLLKQFSHKQKRTGHSKVCEIDPSADISNDTYIAAFTVVKSGASIGAGTEIEEQVYIGNNVKIGENVLLYPGVKIYHECVIGDNCIIHSNAVIGADGFGFKPNEKGAYDKVPQIGNVVIEKNVEIGANCTIDRATMGSTVIKEGAKLDNLVMIAHNVEVGAHTVVAAQAGIAGSTKIGAHCVIGGQAGIVGHIQIANGTKIQAQSGVTKKIRKENTAIYGSPAIDYSNYIKSYAIFKNLPNLMDQLKPILKKNT